MSRPGAMRVFNLSTGPSVEWGCRRRTRVSRVTSRRRSCTRRGWSATRRNTCARGNSNRAGRSEEHTSELQSQSNLVCRLLLEKKKLVVPIAEKTCDHVDSLVLVEQHRVRI